MINNDRIYNVKQFGVRACDSLQTRQFQDAIDRCFSDGGGTVVVPKGIYKIAGIRLRSNVKLHLESGAILEGSRNPKDYFDYLKDEIEPINVTEEQINCVKGRSVNPFSGWSNAIIRAYMAENISITGEVGSYINGRDCYDPNGEEKFRGPHGISIHNCSDVYLSGYSIMNSANWAHNICESQNVTVENITVYGGHDGLDFRSCDNVLVENCELRTGDDSIAGFDNNDVVIRNCILDSACSAMRFGGNNVLVEKCHTYAPASFGPRYALSEEQKKMSLPTDENCRHNMLNVFLYYCDFRTSIRKTPGDILIRDCVFENPDSLFSIYFDGEHKWCCNRSLSSITFENCKAVNVCKPIHIHGDENEPLSFTMKNVTVSAKEGSEDIHTIDAVNFKKIELENVKFEGFLNPEINAESEGEIVII